MTGKQTGDSQVFGWTAAVEELETELLLEFLFQP